MTNQESDKLTQALRRKFNDHDVKVFLAILEGNNTYNQKDVISISKHNMGLLKKLGWFRALRTAIKEAELKLDIAEITNQNN